MTLAAICKRFQSGDFPRMMRRKSSVTEKLSGGDVVHCSSGNFYDARDWSNYFGFSVDDLMADDWEYSDEIWVSK